MEITIVSQLAGALPGRSKNEAGKRRCRSIPQLDPDLLDGQVRLIQHSPGSLQQPPPPIFPEGDFPARAHGVFDRMAVDAKGIGDIGKPHVGPVGEERIHFTQ
jgi:hypothetical protein